MQPLYPMMFVALNGKVFSAGPRPHYEIPGYQWDRHVDICSYCINDTGTRDYGSAVIFDGKVMIAGGDEATGAATNTVELTRPECCQPDMAKRVAYVDRASPIQPHRFYQMASFWLPVEAAASASTTRPNPSTPRRCGTLPPGNWTTMDSITVYRGYHSTALLLPDGRVLSAGGEITGASAEIYSPPYLFKGARPTIRICAYQRAVWANVPRRHAGRCKYHPGDVDTSERGHSFVSTRINVSTVFSFAQATGGLNITAPAMPTRLLRALHAVPSKWQRRSIGSKDNPDHSLVRMLPSTDLLSGKKETMRIHTSKLLGALSVISLLALSSMLGAQSYSVIDIGALPGGNIVPTKINQSGQVIGQSGKMYGVRTHAFVFTGGKLFDIGTLPGGEYSSASDVNTKGTVVGESNTATNIHAFIWDSAGGLQDLGTFPGDNGSRAFGINDSDQVVGYSSGAHEPIAFLWTKSYRHDQPRYAVWRRLQRGLRNQQLRHGRRCCFHRL